MRDVGKPIYTSSESLSGISIDAAIVEVIHGSPVTTRATKDRWIRR